MVSVFMIDPPWPKRKGGKRASRPRQGRELDYPTMSVPDIYRLLDDEIWTNAGPDHAVFLWTVDEFLVVAEQEMEKRGYRRHCRFVWDKLNGVAPAFTIRYSHEYLLWFYKRKMLPIAGEQRGKWRTVFQEPARQHSRKPEVAYRIVESLYPNEVKQDVFSRQRRLGWVPYGNQCNLFPEND